MTASSAVQCTHPPNPVGQVNIICSGYVSLPPSAFVAKAKSALLHEGFYLQNTPCAAAPALMLVKEH